MAWVGILWGVVSGLMLAVTYGAMRLRHVNRITRAYHDPAVEAFDQALRQRDQATMDMALSQMAAALMASRDMWWFAHPVPQSLREAPFRH